MCTYYIPGTLQAVPINCFLSFFYEPQWYHPIFRWENKGSDSSMAPEMVGDLRSVSSQHLCSDPPGFLPSELANSTNTVHLHHQKDVGCRKTVRNQTPTLMHTPALLNPVYSQLAGTLDQSWQLGPEDQKGKLNWKKRHTITETLFVINRHFLSNFLSFKRLSRKWKQLPYTPQPCFSYY